MRPKRQKFHIFGKYLSPRRAVARKRGKCFGLFENVEFSRVTVDVSGFQSSVDGNGRGARQRKVQCAQGAFQLTLPSPALSPKSLSIVPLDRILGHIAGKSRVLCQRPALCSVFQNLGWCGVLER